MDEKTKAVLLKLEAACARREYCVSDIRRKALKALDGDESAAGEVVASLMEDRFVDDLRYASAFAREKASISGWGPVKIRFQLRGKGISDSDIATALAEVEPEKASDKLERLLQVKWKTLQDDPQGKLKLIRFALTRGYEYSDVEAAMRKL